MEHKGDAARIKHLLDAAEKAISFTKGKSRGDLASDEKLSLALVRLLEIIGEAAHALSDESPSERIPRSLLRGKRATMSMFSFHRDGRFLAACCGVLQFKQKHPDVQWPSIISTRNRLIHGYFDVDLDIVWNIVTTDLPGLIKKLHS